MPGSSYTRNITIYINGKAVSNDIKTIRGEMKHLINAQAKMTVGSKEYNKAGSEIRKLDKIMKDHRSSLQSTGKAWQTIKNFLPIASIGAAVAAVGRLAKKMKEMAVALSDEYADVQKTTGLTKTAVQELSKELDKINTKSSRSELLSLARIAGKLGIKGKRDILDFVEAADQINVALSEDLGGNIEETVRQLGKLIDVFGMEKEFGMKEGLLKIGSAINSIGAASTASEQYLVEFAKRMGGIATQANISLPSVLGYGSALDQLGQSSEVSATTLNRVWVEMFRDVETYSGIAGLSIADFNELLQKDANAAFIAFLDGLNGNNEGLSVMAKKLEGLGLEGARSTQILSVLAGNTAMVAQEQVLANEEFKKGTSLTEEFNIKNETLAANLAKIGNHIKNKLVGSGLVNFLNRWAGAIVKLTKTEEEHIDLMRIDTTEMNASFEALKSKNISMEAKRKLIEKINEKYGQYLPNLLTEKSTIEDIEKAQAASNKQYRLKIIQTAFQEEITNLMKAELAAQEGLVTGEIMREEAAYKRATVTNEADAAYLEQQENAIELASQLNNAIIDNHEQEVQSTRDKFKRIAEIYQIGMDEIEKILEAGAGEVTINPLDQTDAEIKATDELAKIKQKAIEALLQLNDEQYRSQATANEREIEDIQRKYEAIIEQAMAAGLEIKELETQRDQEVNDAILRQNEERQKKEEDMQREFEERKLAIRQQYNLLSVDELQALELEKLQKAYDEKLLTEEEFQAAKKEIQDRYAGIAAEEDAKTRDEKLEEIREYYATFEALAQTAANLFNASQDLELAKLRKTYDDKIKAAGDNNDRKEQLTKELAEKEKAIKKKQANTEFLITIAQIIANTALAVAKVWGQTGIAGVVAQAAPIAMGLLELGIAVKQRQIVMQAYRGRYPVTGADDGRTYHADYHGRVEGSQIFPRPTLISERGGELVATAEHVNNVLRLNPALFNDFMSYRVPQRAEGSYPASSAEASAKAGNQPDTEMKEILMGVRTELAKLNSRPIKAYTVHSEVKKYEDLLSQIEAYASGD